MRSERLAATVAIAVALIATCSLVAILSRDGSASETASSALPRPQAMPIQLTSDDRHFHIQPKTLAEGRANFFVYDTDDQSPVRFFIVRLPDERYAAALDTCKGCYKQGLGYAVNDQVLVCRKCGHRVPVAMDQPQPDDCHPVRLDITADHDIRIPVDDMMALASQYTPVGTSSD